MNQTFPAEIIVTREIKGKVYTLKTGYYAKQANGAVFVSIGNTEVLATAVMSNSKPDTDFFPLSVHYIEKFYASGRIPGGYFKRESKPTDAEVLISRLIDRPLRPLFPDGFRTEVQVLPTVMSMDLKNPADIVGMIASSAALCVSDIPFHGPVGAVRVGLKNGEFLINPTYEERQGSVLELMVAGTKKAITMIEGECKELSEEQMLDALEKAHEAIKEIVSLQEELIVKAGKPKLEVFLFQHDASLVKKLNDEYRPQILAALEIKEKIERYAALGSILENAKTKYNAEAIGEELVSQVVEIIHDIEKEIVREDILIRSKRQDGRAMDEIRPIDIKLDVLQNVHGSACFTRGQTQVVSITTLGSGNDNLKIDLVSGSVTKNFFLHYNFPPFSVGEVGRIGATGRREIGHGMLAERSLEQMMPSHSEYGYTTRIVSEVLESNGSSSMATICSGSLSLMCAGVPLKKHVAGIAMGLIMEGDKYQILTDIQGMEDHLGDMDFKVAGTKDGITGFQLDIKIEGITIEIMRRAMDQAKKARLFILDKMYNEIAEPRKESNPNAPQRTDITVPVAKIRNVIGSGGKNIKDIVEKTGSDVEIEDNGTIHIFSRSKESLDKTIKMIEMLTGVPEIGKIYEGPVRKVAPFGCFIEIMPGTDGLCHISELDEHRVNDINSYISEGTIVRVKVKEIDDQGRVSLTRKGIPQP